MFLVCLKQSCPLNISQPHWLLSEGSTLPQDEIISSHTVKSGIIPIECYEICQKEPKCVGFNYRDKISDVNCQLTNVTGDRNHMAMTGEWILMLDGKAICN